MTLKKYHSVLLTLVLLITACDKNLEVEIPSFDVADYEVTDAVDSAGNAIKQVIFNIQGNSDVISFYSGELFHQYAFKEGRVVGTDSLNMSFVYNAQLGLGTVIREDQLTVLASTDFNGQIDSLSVHDATWKDITQRFSLLQVKDIPSGEYIPTTASISDLTEGGTPFYIAFKYVTPPQTADEKYSRWQIRQFVIDQETALGVTEIATQSTAPFTLFHTGPVESGRSSSTATQIQFRGNFRSTTDLTATTVDWAISPAIVAQDDLDLGPDRPISIKTRVAPVIKTYTYNYSKAGTYKVAFVATNVTTKGEETVVKEMEIVVP